MSHSTSFFGLDAFVAEAGLCFFAVSPGDEGLIAVTKTLHPRQTVPSASISLCCSALTSSLPQKSSFTVAVNSFTSVHRQKQSMVPTSQLMLLRLKLLAKVAKRLARKPCEATTNAATAGLVDIHAL